MAKVMHGRVGSLSDGGGTNAAEDLDERTRRQYLAIAQFLQEKELWDTVAAFASETGITYEDGYLPTSSVLQASLDMFANYGASNSASHSGAAEEEELLQIESGICCTGPFENNEASELNANITAVAWAVSGDDDFVALAASADRKVRVLGPDGQILTECSDFPSPLLGLDVARTSSRASQEVLATAMGGETLLLQLNRPESGKGSDGWGLEVRQRFRDHTKHVTSGRFAPPADRLPSAHFLTVSRDHQAKLYRRAPEESGDGFVLAGTMRFGGEVTCCCWVNDRTFALAARDDHHLHYWDIDGGADAGPKERVKCNLNATGDSVVSFAVLALDVSADGALIAACTDRSRVIVLQTFTSKQLRNLYGATIDEYDVPSVCFSSDRSFVYVTSSVPYKVGGGGYEEELTPSANAMCGEVLIFQVQSGEKVLTLPCHKKAVRCMAHHPHTEALVTGSFDRTVRFWQ